VDFKKVLKHIPHSPGVYLFADGQGGILYIGKAGNLKKRVSSYFHKRHIDPRVERLVSSIRGIDYIPTSSSAEALIYEASLIKEKKPKFNIALKDDKSYPYLKLSARELYPRLMITRKREKDGSLYFGPYTNVRLLRQAVTLLKRVFPLRTCNVMPKKECLNYHITQCLGPCIRNDINTKYKEVVCDIKLFLKGKKKALIKRLSTRMKQYSDRMEYEQALQIKKQLEALCVVVDESSHSIPLDSDLKELKHVLHLKTIPARIEAFDISNIHGKDSVGSMVTFFNARPLKDRYRKYKIKTVSGIDDYSMIKEVVRRRYRRLLDEKKNLPDLILIDGGRGHLRACLAELKTIGLTIPVVSIAKRREDIYAEGKNGPLPVSRKTKASKLLQRIRDEAHRFAISYHKLLRKKSLFKNSG